MNYQKDNKNPTPTFSYFHESTESFTIELKEDNGLSGLKNGIAIKKELGGLIPSYMVPRNIKIVKQFPTNVNGKIDRKKLLEEL